MPNDERQRESIRYVQRERGRKIGESERSGRWREGETEKETGLFRESEMEGWSKDSGVVRQNN